MSNGNKPSMREFFDWDEDVNSKEKNRDKGREENPLRLNDTLTTEVESTDIEIREFDIDELVKNDLPLARMMGKEAAARLIAMQIEKESKGRIRYRNLGQDKIDEN